MKTVTFGELKIGAPFMFSGIWYYKINTMSNGAQKYNAHGDGTSDYRFFSNSAYVQIDNEYWAA